MRQVQRTADVETKLVAFERRFACVEKVTSVERFVAKEFENLAVIGVRAGTCGDVHDRAGVSTVLSAESRVINLELLHGIDRRLKRDLVLDHIVEVDAVNHEVDRVFTTARGIEREGSLAAKRRSQESVLRWGDRTRNEQTQVNEVPAVERNFLYRPLVDYSAHRSGCRLDDGNVG